MTRQSEAWSERLGGLVSERERVRRELRKVERRIMREATRARNEGATVAEVAEVCGVSRQSVYGWAKR